MKCPNCEAENPDDYVYCGRCGTIVLAAEKADRQKVEQIKAAIKQTMATRRATDIIVPSWWLAAFLLFEIVAVIMGAATMVSAMQYGTYGVAMLQIECVFIIACSAASSLFIGIMAYYLVKRQNDHFSREWDLRANMLNLFKALAGSPERERLIFRDVGPMLAAHQNAEAVREPWFWAVIAGLPGISTAILFLLISSIVSWDMTDYVLLAFAAIILMIAVLACGMLILYMIYFLCKTMKEHDKRWAAFSYGAVNVLAKFGILPDWPYTPQALQEREFAIYLMLSIFIPFFAVYWLYTLIIDPNDHFRRQWKYEEWLIGALDKLRH